MKLIAFRAKESQARKGYINERFAIPRSKVSQRSFSQKAHVLEVTLFPAKYETEWQSNYKPEKKVKEYISEGNGTKVRGQSKVIPLKGISK